VQVFRIWVEAATRVSAVLTFDTTGWGAGTTLTLSSTGPAGAVAASKTFSSAGSGEMLTFVSGAQGWYTFNALLRGAAAALKNPYTLSISYQAPQKLT
jgi:hypothetical protein